MLAVAQPEAARRLAVGVDRDAGQHRLASLNEGFGLPILEAMRRGVPVACSRASALPEVAGEAALYFDPRSVPDIARAIDQLLDDPKLTAGLIERGLKRQATFTWEAAAEHTLQSYEQARRKHQQGAA